MENVSIGIIGGMGPQASALLHQKLVRAVSLRLGARMAHEFPMIVHVSLPVRDFISDCEARHQSKPLLRTAARLINSANPDAVIIACNTAHMLVDELPELGTLPLISLPHAVLKQAENRGTKRLGLIASPTTLRSRLYERCAAGTGIEIASLPPHRHAQVEEAIRGVIAGEPLPPIRKQIQKLADELFETGVDMVALGCTELSVAMQGVDQSNVIDSLTAVTEMVIEQFTNDRAVKERP